MSATDFDFDYFESNLNVGLEVEYPRREPDDEYLVDRGRPSNDVQSRCNRMPMNIGGNPVYDGTVGLEVVSDVIPVEDAADWYRDVVDHIESEYNTAYQPTGLLTSGSTAGLHIHLSPLSRSEARELFEISQTPWAKVLFCSSIARHEDTMTWPVFRGGRYCQMNFDSGHYNCVNPRSNNHYEWRMPEPVTLDHIEVVMRFLDLFKQDASLARDYAQELLDSGDDRITAIKRAEAAGMDLAGLPEVRRAPADNDPDDFYETVENSWHLPQIHTVEIHGDEFYTFESDLEGEFEAEGIVFRDSDVLWADTLEVVTDEEVRDEVARAYRARQSGDRRETEATEELKKIIKKKKGTA